MRPLKQGLSYFPHDTDAVSDEKIEALMALYGCEGYAFFFVLLERIYRTENGVLPMGKLTDKVGITRKLGIAIDRFDQILASACEIGCFVFSDNGITSNGVKKRISQVLKIRTKERERKDKYKRKGKTSVGKHTENPRKTLNPLINNGKFIPPKLEEVQDYCKLRGNQVSPEKWHNFYTGKGWMIGKNKMKDWKAAVRTWEEEKGKGDNDW